MSGRDEKAVEFWQDRILFQQGQYVYIDQNGAYYPITHEDARKKERDFQSYQAQMACQRGGLELEQAMGAHGFVKNAHGGWDYNTYMVDRLSEERAE